MSERKLFPVDDTNHAEIKRDGGRIEVSYYRCDTNGEAQSINRMNFSVGDWYAIADAIVSMVDNNEGDQT